MEKIPFNRPYMTGKELHNISKAHHNGMLAGDGPYTKRCHEWLETHIGANKSLLTHSCTAALEMAAILLDLVPGDEVIMPSYTFVSTANAFVLRSAVPVFVDIRSDTLNINEKLVEDAITPRTKAIVPVHYAGVACEMDMLLEIARRKNLRIVEDAAQGFAATYKGRALGTIGDLGAYSFHETKNIISGEGGALLVNAQCYTSRAEIIREKGTNRSQFFRGEVDKYTWQDIGSSFLPGELIAAFLWAQFEEAEQITQKRIELWNNYHRLLYPLEQQELLRRQFIPAECQHNAHMYYIITKSAKARKVALDSMKKLGIHSVFHYVPLHSSPGGKKFTRIHGAMTMTDNLSDRLIRLPMWVGMNMEQQEFICSTLKKALIGVS